MATNHDIETTHNESLQPQEMTTMATKKARKDRSDITVGAMEKKHGMPPGTVRNDDGRDTRSDKKLGTIRKSATKRAGKK
jgi:hypothetical protein